MNEHEQTENPQSTEEKKEKSPVVVKGHRIVPILLLGLAILIFLGSGIDWTVSSVAHPLFSIGGNDFKNVDKLVEKLESPDENDPVSRFVWEQFSEETQNDLSLDALPPQFQEKLLVPELNKILKSGVSIYGDQLFPSDVSGYGLKRISVNKAGQIPVEDKKRLVIVEDVEGEEGELLIRVFNSEGEEVIYDEDFLADRKLDEEQKKKLEVLRKDSDENEVTGDEVTSLLGYTGLSPSIDTEKKLADKPDGDRTLLNRLLLEYAYPDEINTANYDSKWFITELGVFFRDLFKMPNRDVPIFIKTQFWTVLILGLCALLPGLAGLIYRRAFWKWFLAAFVLLYLINWMFSALGLGAIGANAMDRDTYRFYLWVEALLILLLLVYNLRRQSAEIIDAKTRTNKILLGVFLILLAIGWGYLSWFSFLQSSGALMLLLFGISILWQSIAASTVKPKTGKNIVVCFDGTWNQPGQKDHGYLAETNVFKLFKMLKGAEEINTIRKKYHASQYKEYTEDPVDGADDKVGTTKQIAFYYHGVGNKVENSQLGQLFGGAFGMGANGVVDRAYLDVVREYQPGDRIFVFGFSRGAAIARLFAGEIGRRGFPKNVWSLNVFGRHLTVWKSSDKERTLKLFGWRWKWKTSGIVKVPADKQGERPRVIKVLGCWDTVASFGISKNLFGIPFQEINLLKDLTVSDCVKRAYHMVALDETRDAFVPTLMDPDPVEPNRIVEVWFSGSHCNVGGGYATDRLSDMTLDFLLRHVSSDYACKAKNCSAGADPSNEWFLPDKEWFPSCCPNPTQPEHEWGLYLKPEETSEENRDRTDESKFREPIQPDARGQLRESTGTPYTFAPRKMPIHAVIYDSVFDRMKKVLPVYAPQSLFDLNEELAKKREPIQKEIDRRKAVSKMLQEKATSSGEKEARGAKRETDEKLWQEALDWSNEKLILTKWSEYLKREVEVRPEVEVKLEAEQALELTKKPLRATLNPAEELKNPIPIG